MEMKHYKNKIITCTIMIALLLSDIGLKNIFFLPPQSVDVLSRFIYTALWLSYSWFQTSQSGCQQYSDTSPFSVPCLIQSYNLVVILSGHPMDACNTTTAPAEESKPLTSWTQPPPILLRKGIIIFSSNSANGRGSVVNRVLDGSTYPGQKLIPSSF